MQTSGNSFSQNRTSREPRRPLGAAATLANHAAFTLIEIVLVITIISILGAALIYGIKGNVDVAKETRVEADIKAIVTQRRLHQ